MKAGDYVKIKTGIKASVGRIPEGLVKTEVTENIKSIEGKVVKILEIDIFTLDLFVECEYKTYRVSAEWVERRN